MMALHKFNGFCDFHSDLHSMASGVLIPGKNSRYYYDGKIVVLECIYPFSERIILIDNNKLCDYNSHNRMYMEVKI